MGEDGHTASLFPGSPAVELQDQICAVARHPLTGQDRVTLTLPVINRARKITFLVTGKSKSTILQKILNPQPGNEMYPAARVKPEPGKLEWLLDHSAAALLSRK